MRKDLGGLGVRCWLGQLPIGEGSVGGIGPTGLWRDLGGNLTRGGRMLGCWGSIKKVWLSLDEQYLMMEAVAVMNEGDDERRRRLR